MRWLVLSLFVVGMAAAAPSRMRDGGTHTHAPAGPVSARLRGRPAGLRIGLPVAGGAARVVRSDYCVKYFRHEQLLFAWKSVCHGSRATI